MTVIQSSLFHIVKRFPDQKEVIAQFYRKKEDFQTICDDYRRCFEALQGWNQSNSREAPARRKEYSDLLDELEMEIRRYLKQLS